jgi:dihydrofolate synthase/folylpolyglutamate synthase
VLGDTLEKIAYEKAGIIKEGVPVVSAPQEEEAILVIEEICRKKKANLVLVGRDWIWEQGEADLEGQEFGIKRRDARGEVGRFWIPLIGKHQLINATVAIASVHQLHRYGIAIPKRSIEEGLRLVRWPGRLEILGREPFVVLDCAHNPDSARKLAEALRDYFSYERLLLVFGASADKDIAGMLKALLPLAERIFFTKAKHPRAADPHSLVREALAQGREAFEIQGVAEALCFALEEANLRDLVCVTGSIFVVAEAKEAWLERKGDEMPERD